MCGDPAPLPEHRRELRCCRCGEPWSEEAPPCCVDPVDDYLTVTRTRRTGRVLESVIRHDGEVIAAVWVSDEKVTRSEDRTAGIHRSRRTTFKSPAGLSGQPEVELDEGASFDPPPPRSRSTDLVRGL